MSSHYFRIEVYGVREFGCPDYNLMGYGNFQDLLDECWNKYYKSFAKQNEICKTHKEAGVTCACCVQEKKHD